MKLKSIIKRKAVTPHIDITTEKNHNFFANDILTHNCNLPARNVIITGVTRGLSTVDELDLIQMMGRAGRPGWDTAGTVHMIVPEGSVRMWQQTFANPRPVISKLLQKETIAFHLLGEINIEQIIEYKDVDTWYERSLAWIQTNSYHNELIKSAFTDLQSMGMVKVKGDSLNIKKLGRISAWLYYTPYDIHDWKTHFDTLFDLNRSLTNRDLAWALGEVHSNMLPYTPTPLKDSLDEWMAIYRKEIGTIPILRAINDVMGYYHCLEGSESTIQSVKTGMYKIRADVERVCTAIELIDTTVAKWGYDWKSLQDRVKYGVSPEVAVLVRIPGIGKVRAERLYTEGFTTLAKLRKATVQDVAGILSPQLFNSVQKHLKKIGDKENV